MSSQQYKRYKCTLARENSNASLYGFRKIDENGRRYQTRIFDREQQLEDYEAEMWTYGFELEITEYNE